MQRSCFGWIALTFSYSWHASLKLKSKNKHTDVSCDLVLKTWAGRFSTIMLYGMFFIAHHIHVLGHARYWGPETCILLAKWGRLGWSSQCQRCAERVRTGMCIVQQRHHHSGLAHQTLLLAPCSSSASPGNHLFTITGKGFIQRFILFI